VREHLVRVRLTEEELHTLDVLAAERGQIRSSVLRSAINPDRSGKADALGEDGLVSLLEERARAGNVRAIELLLRRL
jgi:hypothetical protein